MQIGVVMRMSRPNHRSVRVRAMSCLLAASAVAVALPSMAIAGPCWSPPVVARVVDPFREPTCRWCPGNRGLEYGTVAGVAVNAVSTGRVTFAGSVAGTIYLVVRHADGLRVTYGGLATTRFEVGDVVVRGAAVGTTSGPLHLGVRDGDRYIDPSPLIGSLRYRVRLVPASADRPVPSPPPTLVCSSRSS